MMDKYAWECWHGCGRKCSNDFYQHMIKVAKHPPLCVCRYGALNKSPWSLWKKVDQQKGGGEDVDLS